MTSPERDGVARSSAETAAPAAVRRECARVSLPLLAFALTIAACARIGWRTLDLPPGMHDEYSYLFQAETFLSGRFWLPSQNAIPGLFDQIHVLNEGRFASRYFPGTGLWLAPFVALGHPYLGQWLAAGLAAVLLLEAARAAGGSRAGLVAGLLFALAPGVADFCNLLASHAPTLLGLSLFLCGFARARSPSTTERARGTWSLASGAGLAFAMLCRPLTAAAVGLPFGLALLAALIRDRRAPTAPEPDSCAATALSASSPRPPPRRARRALVATGVPIALGLLFLAAYDVSITGSLWKTPYGLYNDLYTPRHVYGFENGTRGDAAPAPKRDVDYDRWARNLTWPAAVANARARLTHSLRAGVGAVPFAMGVLLLVLARRRADPFWLLCAAAAAALHLAHVPYWFVGINAYHYVLESIPLYALVFAGSVQVVESWAGERARGRARTWLPSAWAALALVPAAWPWLPVGAPLQTRAGLALQRGSSFLGPRLAHARFLRLVDDRVTQRPALVLVEQPPRDFHVDYVVNLPALDAPVIFGRYEPARMKIAEIEAAFPSRAIYLFNEWTGRLQRVDSRRPVSRPPST